MAKLLDRTPQLFSARRANELAKMLNMDYEDDWSYKACHDPAGTGQSFIKVYDETNTYIADL